MATSRRGAQHVATSNKHKLDPQTVQRRPPDFHQAVHGELPGRRAGGSTATTAKKIGTNGGENEDTSRDRSAPSARTFLENPYSGRVAGRPLSNWQVMGMVAEADLVRALDGADSVRVAAPAKLVLLRLAWSLNPRRNGTYQVWPSVGHVARDCHLSRSTVKRAMRALERAKLICLSADASQWHTARWVVDVDILALLRLPRLRVSARRPNRDDSRVNVASVRRLAEAEGEL